MYCKIIFLDQTTILGLCLDSFTNTIKPSRTVLAFLFFKNLTHLYVVKTSTRHSKYLTTRF